MTNNNDREIGPITTLFTICIITALWFPISKSLEDIAKSLRALAAPVEEKNNK